MYTVEDGTYSTLFIEAENKKHLLVAIEERCQDGPKIKSLRKIYEEFAQEALNSLEEAQNSLTLENLQIFFLNYQRIAAGLPITTFFGRTGCEKLIQ